MRARVIRSFKDIKANLALRKEGEVLEADDSRIADLAKKGFVKPMDEPKPEIEDAPIEDAPEKESKPKSRKKKSAKKK